MSTNNICWRRCGEKGTLYTVGGNVNCCSHCGKQVERLPYDPAISILGKHWEKMKTPIPKDTCTPIFTAALFSIAKIWMPPKRPSTEEWIKKIWCA